MQKFLSVVFLVGILFFGFSHQAQANITISQNFNVDTIPATPFTISVRDWGANWSINVTDYIIFADSNNNCNGQVCTDGSVPNPIMVVFDNLTGISVDPITGNWSFSYAGKAFYLYRGSCSTPRLVLADNKLTSLFANNGGSDLDQLTFVSATNYTPSFQLTTTLNPQAGGTVASTSGGPGSIDCPSTSCQDNFSGNVTLAATPADGWSFAYWDDGCSSTNENPHTIAMSGNRNVKAIFKLLSFPIAGYNAYNAPVSAVFDHAATTEYEGDADNHVETFKGEISTNQNPYGDTDCYLKSDNSAFGLGFNYVGAVSSTPNQYLCYSGHPGYDYHIGSSTNHVPIYSAAKGIVRAIVSNETEEDKLTCAGNYVEIEHAGGYKTRYLHLHSVDTNNAQLNQEIQTNVQLGTSGNTGTCSSGYHLHFQVNKVIDGNNIPVDPYGWEGSGDDPYTRAMNYNLWK